MPLPKDSTFQFCVIAYIFNVFGKFVMLLRLLGSIESESVNSVSISHLMLSQSLPVKYLKLEPLTN